MPEKDGIWDFSLDLGGQWPNCFQSKVYLAISDRFPHI